jgi:ATP-binding cassette subfamily F protein 3
MSIIRFQDIFKSFGGETILSDVDLRVEDGEKIGLIGRNGTGKSTLFRLMTGEISADGGTVERMRKARLACLDQFPDVDPAATIHDTAMDTFQDVLAMEIELGKAEEAMADGNDEAIERYSALQEAFAAAGGYDIQNTIKRVLVGLGFREEEFTLPISALSGGQRTRLMLALVLLQDADLLLLDEPENHLDIAAREWLENFLKDWPKAFVIVSHDRQILNAVAQRIIEVEQGGVRSYTGNYDRYQKEKALLRDQHEKAYQRQQDFIEKEQRLINRFRAKATKAKQMQSRLKRLDKLDRVEAPPPEVSTARFHMGDPVRSGEIVVDAQGLTMGYGDLQLYQDVSFQVQRGERVGIIGPNGSGKSTLLRQIASRLDGGEGVVALGHKVSVGYYDQHHETLNPANDIFKEIATLRSDMRPEEIRAFMARFLFMGQDVFKTISALSGGEKARVAIAKLILEGPNLILLDEPTNHLDIASREILENALTHFTGTIVVVSHDRALVDSLVEKLVVLEDGKTTVHLGNYSQYRWKQGVRDDEAKDTIDDSVMLVRQQKDRSPKKKGRESQKEANRRRKRFAELEDQIQIMEAHITDFESQFKTADPTDHETLHSLHTECEALKTDLSEMYEEWELLAADSD